MTTNNFELSIQIAKGS